MKTALFACGLALSVLGCGGSVPRMAVADMVQKIEKDEVNAHMLRDEWVELEGILVQKHVDQSNALLLSGQNSNTNSLSGASRRGPIEPATAVLVDAHDRSAYTALCEFSDFGADRLNRTKTGSRVTVRCVLRSWERVDGQLVPSFDTCSLQ